MERGTGTQETLSPRSERNCYREVYRPLGKVVGEIALADEGGLAGRPEQRPA